ncbi:MAG: hypothetical protein IKT52_08340 [Oscillospiraceae bacterium]|nr:hypothetical protein [Oscillospiraceae bacterium]
MKKLIFVLIAVLILLSACGTEVPEPERCSLCNDLPRHAPCIINLSTGEKLELDVYEPHPFLVGEIAEEQRGGYFSFVRGAGVEGYKLGAKSVTITIPVKSDRLDQQCFCNNCRELLADYKNQGYALVDLKDAENPVVYAINTDTKATFRCYEISVQKIKEDGKYEITIIGTLKDADSPKAN